MCSFQLGRWLAECATLPTGHHRRSYPEPPYSQLYCPSLMSLQTALMLHKWHWLMAPGAVIEMAGPNGHAQLLLPQPSLPPEAMPRFMGPYHYCWHGSHHDWPHCLMEACCWRCSLVRRHDHSGAL